MAVLYCMHHSFCPARKDLKVPLRSLCPCWTILSQGHTEGKGLMGEIRQGRISKTGQLHITAPELLDKKQERGCHCNEKRNTERTVRYEKLGDGGTGWTGRKKVLEYTGYNI